MLEILLITIIVLSAIRLFWEMIPDPVKKYFGYIRSVNRDRKKGRRRKYVFTWRRENQ
ncbi:MAG: hypothetical protein KAT69_10115 [Candidatus Aminicenantes bacterium]|nr:hypothetical protein [Candidatus Aminicenantes bacterium]